METITKCKFIVTSADRTPEHNKKVGGVEDSYHLKKDSAIDIVPKCNKSIEEIGEILCKYVSTIMYKRHIHIDNRENKLCLKKF